MKEFVTAYYATATWQSPDKKVTRYKVIIDHNMELKWVFTDDPELAKQGSHIVEFYKDYALRELMRKPKKDGKYEKQD